MTRTFIQTKEFLKNWERMGLTDDDLRRTAYAKNEQENLSKSECNEIKKLITILEDGLKEEY